jgi:hypothetical protein
MMAVARSRRPRGRWLALALALVAALAVGAALLLMDRGPKPRWFAEDSVWNQELERDAPLAKDSARLSGRLRKEVSVQQKGRFGPWMNTREFSAPIYEVPEDQPTVAVKDAPGEEVMPPEMVEAFSRVPIPPGARPAKGSDGHLVIWQPGTDTMWEFWVTKKSADGWTARWGGRMEDVSENPGYFIGKGREHWGATATSLPLVAGTVTLEDLERGRIDHALALAIPDAKSEEYVWPAQRTDGQDTAPDAIPEGTRFRIDPDVDLKAMKLPRLTRMLAEAAQRYGMIVRDRSTVVSFFGEDPTPTGKDPYGPLIGDRELIDVIGDFPWRHVQAVAVPAEHRQGQ